MLRSSHEFDYGKYIPSHVNIGFIYYKFITKDLLNAALTVLKMGSATVAILIFTELSSPTYV